MEEGVLTYEAHSVEDFENAVAVARKLKCNEIVRSRSCSETQTLTLDFLGRRGERRAAVVLRYSSRTAAEYRAAIASLAKLLRMHERKAR